MSIFSSDIIEKELDYDPDPDKNMRFQIERKFKMVCDMYSSVQPCSVLTFLKDEMVEFMEVLQQNTGRIKNSPVLPEWWRGDFMYIVDYGVTIIQLANGWSGVQVSWKYTNTLEYRCIDLCIDITGFMKKYKNWCI